MSVTSEVEKRSQSKVSGTNGSEDRTKGLVERERLRMMMLIRRFEEKTEQAYKTPRQLPDGTSERLIGGFCHLYSGQEAIAVGIAAVFNKGLDALINGYRCHGHSLALGMDPRVAIAELFGRETGCGLNMPNNHVDGKDVDVAMEEMKNAAARARRGEGPCYISADTFRFRGHSTSDPLKYRTKEEAEKAKLRDPITLYETRLREKGLLSNEQQTALEEGVAEEVNRAFEIAEADPNPPLDSRFDDALSETYPYQPK